MKQLLLTIYDRISTAIFGHSYRWRRQQREYLKRLARQDEIKNRLAIVVVTRLRADLNAPDEAGW